MVLDVNIRVPKLRNVNEATASKNTTELISCDIPVEADLRDFRIAGAKVAQETQEQTEITLASLEAYSPEQQQSFLEGLLLAAYQQARIGKVKRDNELETVYLSGVDEQSKNQALVQVEASYLARDLTNTPSNIKNPSWMAQQVKKLADIKGLTVTIKDYETLKKEGFGGICAVGQGSATPPCLIHVHYEPEEHHENLPHYALIGKGITFDTGGLNLKPGEGMATMKTDMEGAAVMFAVTRAAAQTALPLKIDCLMAMAENALGSPSYRPSDVITMYDGTTVEVGNTDAEGRMVMADALSYARIELKPDYLIDVATLTGAASASTGKEHAAFYSNNEDFAQDLISSANIAGEYLWRMPLPEEYRAIITNCEQADVLQVAYDVGGGSVMAALFLQEFVGKLPWAHFDIAGPGRWEKPYHEYAVGASGFGARALIEYFSSVSEKNSVRNA
ncbi:MAG: leucyl aminopeptidase family protein [Micrococcaceae bacterium]